MNIMRQRSLRSTLETVYGTEFGKKFKMNIRGLVAEIYIYMKIEGGISQVFKKILIIYF